MGDNPCHKHPAFVSSLPIVWAVFLYVVFKDLLFRVYNPVKHQLKPVTYANHCGASIACILRREFLFYGALRVCSVINNKRRRKDCLFCHWR